jgi:hypothetical protein
MNEQAEHGELLRDLVARVAALEENVAFLEVWCEEQQDALDRYGDVYFYPDDISDSGLERTHLYVIDGEDTGEELDSDYERRLQQLRLRLSDVRNGMEGTTGGAVPNEIEVVSRTIDLTTPAPGARPKRRVDQKPAAGGETRS